MPRAAFDTEEPQGAVDDMPVSQRVSRGRGVLAQRQIDTLAESMLTDKRKYDLGFNCWYLHREKGMRVNDIARKLVEDDQHCPITSGASVGRYVMAFEAIALVANPSYSLDALKLAYYATFGEIRRLITAIWEGDAATLDAILDRKDLTAVERTALVSKNILSEHSKHQLTQGYLFHQSQILQQLLRLEGFTAKLGSEGEREDITAETAQKIVELLQKGEGVELEEKTRTVRIGGKPEPDVIEGELIGADGLATGAAGEAGQAADG